MNNESFDGFRNIETYTVMKWICDDKFINKLVMDISDDAYMRSKLPSKKKIQVLSDYIEDLFDTDLKLWRNKSTKSAKLRDMYDDIGSLWRVDWIEVAETCLELSKDANS